MNLKKLGLGIIVLTLIAPVALTGCVEKTETERVEIQKDTPVVVPDRDIDVNVQTQPAPVIEKKTETNTTIDRNTTGGVKTETKVETKSVN